MLPVKYFINMKNLKTLAVALFISIAAIQSYAQNAHEVAVKISKVEQKAIAADYSYSKSLVQTALDGRFSRAGFGKSKSKSGFSVYSGVTWQEIAPTDKLDVWVKTEEKKGNTTLTILISRGYDNFMTSVTDSLQIENLKNFMNSLNADIVAADLAEKIEEQMKAVKVAEDKLAGLKKDNEKLQNDKQKIEKNIAQNEEAQKKSAADVDAEKAKLESLRVQQKN